MDYIRCIILKPAVLESECSNVKLQDVNVDY